MDVRKIFLIPLFGFGLVPLAPAALAVAARPTTAARVVSHYKKYVLPEGGAASSRRVSKLPTLVEERGAGDVHLPSLALKKALVGGGSKPEAVLSPLPTVRVKNVAHLVVEESKGFDSATLELIDGYADVMVKSLEAVECLEAETYRDFFRQKLAQVWGMVHAEEIFACFKESLVALFTMRDGAGRYEHSEPYEKLRDLKAFFRETPFGGVFGAPINEDFAYRLSAYFPNIASNIKGPWLKSNAGKTVGESWVIYTELIKLEMAFLQRRIVSASGTEEWVPYNPFSEGEKEGFALGAALAFIPWYRMWIDGEMPLNVDAV